MEFDVIKKIQGMIDAPDLSNGPNRLVRKMGLDKHLRFTRVAFGEFDLEWRVDPELCLGDDFVQGGVVGVVADMAQSFAFWSTSKGPESYSTSDLHIRFIRPITAGKVMLVASKVMNRSRRIAVIESSVTNVETGKLHAVVTGGWMVADRNLG